MAIEIRIYSDNHVFDRTITYEYIVKKLIQRDQLNSGLESSSSTRQFSILKSYPYLMDILSWNGTGDSTDLHVHIYDTVTTPATNIFTGYLSDKINWGIDSHGADILTLTAEDMGTHLLKNPYTKNESAVISGTFSQCLTVICNTAGISLAPNIPTDSTSVKCVAEAAESCESLLKDLCKEFGFAYYFQADGKMNLKALSSDDLTSIPVIYDNELYDSIQLVKKASQYRGSRITWKKLNTKQGALIYDDTTKPAGSTSKTNCWIELNVGQSYPANTPTAIKASNLINGSEIFAIADVVPDVTWARGSAGTDSIVQYGAESIKVLETCTSAGGLTKGLITKLQAKATIEYVESTETVYGNTDYTSENLYEAECRWIHSQTPAEKYANFCAQYWQYSSNTFTFKTKRDFSLGQIIKLNDNVFTGLEVYLMIQDIKSDGSSDVKTYTAVSTSAFDYNKHTDNESMYVPPSETYIPPMPDVVESSSLTISPDKTSLVKNLRLTGSQYQTLTVRAFVTGGTISGIQLEAAYSDGTAVPAANIHVVMTDSEWTVDVLRNKDVEALNLVMTAGTIEERFSISFIDETQYYKFLGNYASDPTESGLNEVILVGDFYVNTATGQTRECTAKSGSYPSSTLSWADMSLTNAENANKFLVALESATRAGLQLEDMSNPNTVSWFNTIVAAKAVIDTLFSKTITILNPGSIQSSNYAPASEEDVCTYELTKVNPDSFSFDEDTFISQFPGEYGTYRFHCTYATHDPHHSGGDDQGEWALYQNGTVIAIDLEDEDLLTYGVHIDFDQETHTVSVGDEFNITYSHQTIPGQGFYLGSDGTLRCYSSEVVNANATNLVIGGNSSFNGSFNCGVIATDLDGLTSYPYSSSLNERYCKEIIDAMEASSMFIANQLYPCSVSPNPTRNGSMVAVAFMRYEHLGTNTYHLYFYDANKNIIDLKTCDNYQVSYEGGAAPPSRTDFLYTIYNSGSQFGWGGGYFTYHPAITVLTGGNYLRVNVPAWSDRASVPAGCVFTGQATTVSGFTYLPLLVRGGTRTIAVPTSDNTVLQGYNLALDMANEGLAVGTTYDAYVLNSSSQRLSSIAKVAITEAAHTTVGVARGGVTFYDSNGNTVNIASLMTITHKNHFNEDTATNTSQIYSGGITSTGYSNDDSWYCPSGFTVVISENIG